MNRELFGTDGIRAVAGRAPLDAPTVFALGMALGRWAAETSRAHGGGRPRVVLGMDTRESGGWLAGLVAAGLAREGVEPRFAGLTTTPGVAYLTRVEDFVAGVMISASHNPYQDNGIKVFDHSGLKLPDALEHRLEGVIFSLLAAGVEPESPALAVDESLDRHYLDYLLAGFPYRLDGRTVALDCANGSASKLGPALFEALGARVVATGCAPDGRNINLGCGATKPRAVEALVRESGASIGFAFDGDADRCMAVSGTGKLIDGDHVLLIAARRLLESGRLRGANGEPAVVATVMSNLGLERALAGLGVKLLRTKVGDKYVLEEMLARELPLGGEQSGHVIFRDYATTGDGLLTALRVLEAELATGRSAGELTADFEVYPQRLVNVRFETKRPIEELDGVQAAIGEVEREFGERGRVLVRFSGTEPLARVMVEGPEAAAVGAHALNIARAIAAALGGAVSE
jgi:phosphoglucosamine mutase